MKKLSTVALVTGLTLGLGSIAFADNAPAPNNGPNATTNPASPTDSSMKSNVNSKAGSKTTTGSGMSNSTSGGAMAPTGSSAQEKIEKGNSQHQTPVGGPPQGK